MSTLTLEKLENVEEVTVRVSGRVDLHSAEQLRACLERLNGRRLVLEFSNGDFASDAALGSFIGVASTTSKLICRGLPTHQDRIVRYLCSRTLPRA